MTVKIYSRTVIERMLQTGLPKNTAVISFHDSDKAPVDFVGKAERYMHIPLDDFRTDFPEVKKLAEFIHNAVSDGMDFICQCESGQSRSASCAAAILEHYVQSGNVIFNDDRYYIDESEYYDILNALD